MTAVAAVAFGLLRHSTVTLDARSELRPAGVFADASSWQAPAAARPQVGRAAQHAIVAAIVTASVPPPAPAPARPSRPAPEATAALAFAPPEPAQPDITGSVSAYRLASANPEADRSNKARFETTLPSLPRPRPQFAALTPPDAPRSEHPPRTAIYDITAQMVYLPNGERFEAHSGYGPFMDDPKHVHRKNRGATPPNVYRLTLRERLFHGVQALRLTPENESEMFNRDGILAHSYLLGPSGQSHGCVSFKDYPKFLRAFLRGDVDRMIVVTRLDKLPNAIASLDRTPVLAARPRRPALFATRVSRAPASVVRHDVAAANYLF